MSQYFELKNKFEMKLFKCTQQYLRLMAIRLFQTPNASIIIQNCILIASMTFFYVPAITFYIYDAKTLAEYAETFTAASCSFISNLSYLIFINKKKELANFIVQMEDLIKMRKLFIFNFFRNSNLLYFPFIY